MGPLPRFTTTPRVFSWLLLGVFVGLLLGCSQKGTPNLLRVRSISPPLVEGRTELSVLGEGFPEGRTGELLLQGVAYAPARAPQAVSWRFPVLATSRTTIALQLNDRALRTLLAGSQHVTFEGQVVVQFEPLIAGRARLRGTSPNLSVNLFSDKLEDKESPTLSEENDFAEFLGLSLGPELSVNQLDQEGRAAQAGLQVGDRILALDKVRLHSLKDFLPRPDARFSTLSYARRGYEEPGEAMVERSQFQVIDPWFAARTLAALAGVVLSLLWTARPPAFLVWLMRPAQRRQGGARFLVDARPSAQLLGYPIYLGVIVLFYWLLQAKPSALSRFDLLISLALGLGLMVLSSFLLGGARSQSEKRGFSILGATFAAVYRAFTLLPFGAACLIRAGELGSLRLSELAQNQGVGPMDWGFSESPWAFVLSAMALLSLVPLAGRRAPLEGQSGPRGATVSSGRNLEWTGQLVLLGLWVSLYFGGTAGSLGSATLATFVLSLKLAAIMWGLRLIQHRTGRLRLGESWPLVGSWTFVGATLASLVSLLASHFGSGATTRLFETWFSIAGWSFAAAILTLLVICSQRSWMHMGRRSDPWI